MDENNVLPFAIYSELAIFLRTSGSKLSISEALVRAVKQWMTIESIGEVEVTGYQWKSIFLPTGTRLRMRCADQLFYAEVVDEEIIFRNRSTSPSQMAAAVAGEARNAWRDLWVRRPQDKEWSPADKLRRAQVNAAEPREISPTESIQLAAKSMSEALQTALLLVDQSRMRAEQQVDRRLPKHRRRDDYLEDACLED